MKHLDNIVEKDPLRLKNYDVGGKSSRNSKLIYIFMICVPVFLILSLVFYVLGNFTAPENEGMTLKRGNGSTAPTSEPVVYANTTVINEDGEEVTVEAPRQNAMPSSQGETL